MNLFKRSAIAGLLVLSLVACGDSKEKKLEFNNKIVSELSALEKEVQQAINAASAKAPMTNPDEVKKALAEAKTKLDEAVKLMDKRLDGITKLDVPKGGEKLYQATIDDIKTARDFIKNDVASMLDMDPTKPDVAKMQANMKKIQDKMPELMKKDQEVKDAQKAFVKEAGLDSAK